MAHKTGGHGAASMSGSALGLMILLMVLTGSLNTLSAKIQFTLPSVGKTGEVEIFQKPWWGTFNMMFAMFVVGASDKLWRSLRDPSAKPGSVPLLVDEAPPAAPGNAGVPYRQKVLMVSVPAAFDIIATALTTVGILYIPASVWQMLRGSAIVFAAGLSVVFLKRRMYGFNWLGLTLCVSGITMVGIAQVKGSAQASAGAVDASTVDSDKAMFGICCVLAGQVVQAAQLVGEEFLMKQVDLPPMQVIGWEGALGTAMMLVVVYPLLWVVPGNDHGHAEDLVDTLAMIRNNGYLLAAVLTFLFSCATFNATGICITAALSSVHRMMLDASRTILIWAFGLGVHYLYDKTCAFGEAWTSWSPMQMVGFAFLVAGQAIYGEIVKVPGLAYPKSQVHSAATCRSPSAALRLASPLPREREEL